MANLDTVLHQALGLSTLDKLRLIERVTPKIEQEVQASQVQPTKPLRSLWGLCRDFGPAPSSEEIDESRRELSSGFPRNDIV
jgi:hypothetical protein